MGFFVYVVQCSDNTLYTGWTKDVSARVQAHNNGKGAKYTRSRRPVELKYTEELPTRPAALKREWAIKQMTRRQKEQLIQTGRDQAAME